MLFPGDTGPPFQHSSHAPERKVNHWERYWESPVRLVNVTALAARFNVGIPGPSVSWLLLKSRESGAESAVPTGRSPAAANQGGRQSQVLETGSLHWWPQARWWIGHKLLSGESSQEQQFMGTEARWQWGSAVDAGNRAKRQTGEKMV